METCGPDGEQWDYNRVAEKIDDEISQKSLLVLPLATLIETLIQHLLILERWEREFPDACDKLVAELKKEKRTVDQLRMLYANRRNIRDFM